MPDNSMLKHENEKKNQHFFLKKLKTRTKVKLDESLKPVRPGSRE
jgi:hypothetical protein